ncbi:hypothetical protein FR830_25300 (plasmid) [Klebsiella aerogenes]|uniref:hypothetical protein n=1 Tax=Klebsiella aerogenes TaxID=548 RepID=UPI00124E3684|nr:hypothetical protein [Klebsiella aerogenes]QFI19929.1 hypothetical protein FR830_25300 [Klebsiella aerogenes]
MTSTTMASQQTALATLLARVGALAYFIWALLHFQAAWLVYKLGLSMPSGMASGRVQQDAWNLLCFATIAIVATLFNWRNDIRGWWINLVVVSATDIGFIVFVLVPGYMPWWPGVLGPIFWIVGLLLSTAAVWINRHKNSRFNAPD